MIRACFSTHLTFQRHMNTLKSIRCKLKPFSWEENLKQKMPNKHPKLDIQPIILCTAHLLLAPKAVKIKPCSKMLSLKMLYRRTKLLFHPKT